MDQAGLSLSTVPQWIKVDEMDRKCMKMDQIEDTVWGKTYMDQAGFSLRNVAQA